MVPRHRGRPPPARRRTPDWLLHALVVVGLGVVTLLVAVAQTQVGAAVTGLAYSWFGLYVAYWFSRWVALGYALLMVVGFGVGLVVAALPRMVLPWLIVSVSTVAVVLVLSDLVTRLRHQALTDSLTGLLNRAGLERMVASSPAGRAGLSGPRTLVVIDLDDFKQLNDIQGHLAGDRLLRRSGGSGRPCCAPATWPPEAAGTSSC